MKYYVCLIILFLSTSAFSQNYELNIKMKPSFCEKVDITIKFRENGISTIRLRNFYFNETVTLDNKLLANLNQFLDTYEYAKFNNIENQISITDNDSSAKTIIRLDGITVYGNWQKEDNCRTFEFWSPEQGTDNYKLMQLLFSITDTCFEKPRVERYLNGLKGYFKDLTSPVLNDDTYIEFMIRSQPYMVVEKMPEFVGGKDSLNAYFQGCIETNELIKNARVSGKLIIEFIIGEDGAISNAKVFKGLDPKIDDEFVKIIESMPDWIPGKQYGEKVKVLYRIPFSVNKE